MIVKSTCYCIKFWSNINEYWESFRSAAFEVVVHIFKFDLAQGVAMLLRITSLVWVGTTNQAIWGKVTQRSRVEIRIGWRQSRGMSIFNVWIQGQINYLFLIDVTPSTLAGTDLLCMLNWGTQWTMVSYLKKWIKIKM